jgi:hypothetical protein
MAEWVVVNGARIERSFLEENVREARKYVWKKTRWARSSDHVHCIVCNVELTDHDACYRSEEEWLCPYCFERFLQQNGMQQKVSG